MQGTSELPTYRWVIVVSSALMLAVAMGSIVNGMSAYVIPLQQLHGWDRAETSLINVSGIIGLALGGLVMGPLADKRGARPVVLFGSIVLGLCYIAASFAETLWQFYGLIFVAGFLGAAAIFSPIMATVGNWFPVGAGLAIGIASAGQALGQGGVPFASAFMIERYGTDGALGVTGAVMLFVLVPLSLFLRKPPQISGNRAAASSVSEDGYPPFALVVTTLCVAILLCCTCMSVPLMHLMPLIQDRGFTAEEASGVLFAMLIIAIAGRVSFGKLADIIGALPAYMTATAWMTLLIYGFMYMENLGGFYTYAIIYGFGYAGVMTGVLVSIAALTHPSRRAAAMGIVAMFGWFGHANGGYLGGYFFDQMGDYSIAYGVAAASGVLNLIVVGMLYRKTRGPDIRMAPAY